MSENRRGPEWDFSVVSATPYQEAPMTEPLLTEKAYKKLLDCSFNDLEKKIGFLRNEILKIRGAIDILDWKIDDLRGATCGRTRS